MKRRTLLAGTATAGVVGLSGCLSGVLGSVTSLESTPATVSQSALGETGYEQVGVDELVNEEEVDAAGLSDTIVVTSHITEYEKSVGIDGIAEQGTASFSVLSTPKIEIAGRTFNPVAEMSNRELIELIADNYDEIDNVEREDSETVTVLEQSVTKAQFVAEASLDGFPVDLNLHLTEAVDRDDDLLVMIGVYPRLLQSEEAPNVRLLTEEVTDEAAAVDEESDDDETADDEGSESTDDDSEDVGDDSEDADDDSTEDDGSESESTDDSDEDDGETDDSDEDDDGTDDSDEDDDSDEEDGETDDNGGLLGFV